jgi:hypothetical protein
VELSEFWLKGRRHDPEREMDGVLSTDEAVRTSAAENKSGEPVYIYRLTEEAGLALEATRQRLFPKRNLFAGSYVGEFGWEVMKFQVYVRAGGRHYNQTHVRTFPSGEYPCEGCRAHTHRLEIRTVGFWYGRLGPEEAAGNSYDKAREFCLQDADLRNVDLRQTVTAYKLHPSKSRPSEHRKTLWFSAEFGLITCRIVN